ncbi:SpoIIE family protein phosphatase [bacterium]|nr:SpoIIE family protein phosphatase [bacterium]MBT3581682.1 SpoIIE family protein phosphatase [bacterium]MBT4551822.1 SpoIIE family protein phosphatase [bacterium]MBT5988699.1 SpoIIE family protein phosphatase [bacterium]MBT7087340.1 SpoIIE family protein phosphatase [bacterium]
MFRNRGLAFRLSFLVLVSCAFIFVFIIGYNYIVTRKILIDDLRESAQNKAFVVANAIEKSLSQVASFPEHIAYFMESETEFEEEEILGLLSSVLTNNPNVYGSTIAFAPYAFDQQKLYYAPYYYRDGDDIKFKYLGGSDYDYFYMDWFQIPQELGVKIWTDPYYDESGGEILMATVSVPFYQKKGTEKKFLGVITADISLGFLQNTVTSLRIGKTDYGFIISKNGVFMSYPDKNFIMNETIFAVAELKKDKLLRKVGKAMIRGEYGFSNMNSFVRNEKGWLVYVPLSSSGWSLGIFISNTELMAEITNLTEIVILIGLLGFALLLVVIVLIARSITGPIRKLVEKTGNISKGDFNFELKPIERTDEVGKLTSSFIMMRNSLKKYIKELKATTAAKERMESELKIAHDIQMGILPKAFMPSEKMPFSLWALLEPAKEVGGDLYDYFMIDEENFCFVLGDVSGKGVPAALLMAVTMTLIKSLAKVSKDPADIMAKVNDELAKENDACMFVTTFCGILNMKTGKVVYANAGHNPPLMIKKGQKVEYLKLAKGPAVGVLENIEYKKESLILKPGDAIYMYTDGVTEAFNDRDEEFSEKRLLETIELYRDEEAKDLLRKTLQVVHDFSQGVPQSDDITMLVLKYSGGIIKK